MGDNHTCYVPREKESSKLVGCDIKNLRPPKATYLVGYASAEGFKGSSNLSSNRRVEFSSGFDPIGFSSEVLSQGQGKPTQQADGEELRVNPGVYELDQDPEGREMEKALTRLGCNAPVPAVFIDGKLVGSTNEVMSLHLSGNLIPLLKPYQNLS
ncbi:Monothiol glutaredoxin-S9 [Morus notabilis]|uniref:Monothiol glutaredoxin-S9 n=1 Tax=Morus notabilis TaxID=981085 RepID=W9SBL3_9ROSA|nr:Monothiol glutaredoxin-S9 [Morus notabilis]